MSTVTFVSLNCSCSTFLGDQHGSLVTLFLKSILYTLQPKMIGVFFSLQISTLNSLYKKVKTYHYQYMTVRTPSIKPQF
jgi:hypothetical protein